MNIASIPATSFSYSSLIPENFDKYQVSKQSQKESLCYSLSGAKSLMTPYEVSHTSATQHAFDLSSGQVATKKENDREEAPAFGVDTQITALATLVSPISFVESVLQFHAAVPTFGIGAEIIVNHFGIIKKTKDLEFENQRSYRNLFTKPNQPSSVVVEDDALERDLCEKKSLASKLICQTCDSGLISLGLPEDLSLIHI